MTDAAPKFGDPGSQSCPANLRSRPCEDSPVTKQLDDPQGELPLRGKSEPGFVRDVGGRNLRFNVPIHHGWLADVEVDNAPTEPPRVEASATSASGD